ncbi:MAG: nucleotidyl transferase AbiEii/AbiGii toxin family protein [Deltaproteobacteria bacterium]|nr:nucleotidyl transferase AbiEii/AbiGii toxin family protein [Deltaproteobacteria bacterium]
MGTLINDLEYVIQEGKRLNLRSDVLKIKLKEKLQLYVLDFIYNSMKYNHLVFYGGTCLRICFGINRMSEDVDFETTTLFDKKQFANQIKEYFVKNVQYPSISAHTPGSGIGRIELRFPVLYQLGLSAHEQETLIIKVEVNQIKETYPTEWKTVAQDRFSFVIRHYDLPTLMSGKMLACLERIWEKRGVKVKGRDYYDLMWYMQKGVIPNILRLRHAKHPYTIKDAFEQLVQKVDKIKNHDLLVDLEALFENIEFSKKWVESFKERFKDLYRQYQISSFDDNDTVKFKIRSGKDFDSDNSFIRISFQNTGGRTLAYRFSFSEEWMKDEGAKLGTDFELKLKDICHSKVKEYYETYVKPNYKNIIPTEYLAKALLTPSPKHYDEKKEQRITLEGFKAVSLGDLLIERHFLLE